MDNNTEDSGFGEISTRSDVEETSETTPEEQIQTESGDGQGNESEQTDNQESTEGNEDQAPEKKPEESDPELTEKGTKRDPNPQSAVHQDLANARRMNGQMEQVLADPKLIARFMKEQYGIEVPLSGTQPNGQSQETEQPAVTTKKWTAKDFENIEDVADKFNQLQEGFSQQIADRDKKIENLTKEVSGVLNNGRMTQIANATTSDVTSLRAMPELTPSSPDFIPGLENQISNMYRSLDFDKATGTFKGQFSIKEIGEQLIATAREARKAGVKRGQTIIKDKTGGKIRTDQGAKGATDTDNLSPGTSIAKGISKLFG